MPVMTLHEVEDMDEDDSSHDVALSGRSSPNNARNPFPRANSPTYRLKTCPRALEEIKQSPERRTRQYRILNKIADAQAASGDLFMKSEPGKCESNNTRLVSPSQVTE